LSVQSIIGATDSFRDINSFCLSVTFLQNLLAQPRSSICGNIVLCDAQTIRNCSERMLVWPLDLTTLDSGNLFGCHTRKVALSNTFLEAQSAQRTAQRAIGFQLTLLRPPTVVVIKLVQDRIRGGLIIT
jgi:hypothetical protein